MFSIDNPSFKLVAADVTRLVNTLRTEYGHWPGLTEVYYRSANEGIFPRTIESLRLVRRIAISRNDDRLPKWNDFQ